MRFHLPLLLILGLTGAACTSEVGWITDDFEDGHLDENLWKEFSYSATGMLEEKDGNLHMYRLSGGWDGVGVRFKQVIDLTAGPLTVEFRARSGNSEVVCAMTHRETQGDPYLEQPMSEWYVKDGVWKFNSADDGHDVTPKFSIDVDQQRFHTYSLTLSPTSNPQVFDYRTTVDDGALGEARGKWMPNTGDASRIFLYFSVCQEDDTPPNDGSFIDDIFIESPSVTGEAGGCQVGL